MCDKRNAKNTRVTEIPKTVLHCTKYINYCPVYGSGQNANFDCTMLGQY